MDVNSTKCFICDVECVAEEKYLGTNIARTLTMPMTAVLAKCLRTIVDTENEYFCSECTRKIEEYDQMVQLSLQIETELYELFRKKPTDTCYLLDAEIIVDQDAISGEIVDDDNLKIGNENRLMQTVTPDEPPEDDESSEPFEEMVVEYLDEFESQSDDELVSEIKEEAPDEQEAPDHVNQPMTRQKTKAKEANKKTTENVKSNPKIDGKKRRAKGRATKKKPMKKEEPNDVTEVNLNCEKCSFAAKSREELEEHKSLEHFEEMSRLVCDICGRSYKSKSALCVHLGMHNGRNSHECQICGKSFTQRGALVRHMPMHTGERPHQCDVCGKRFIHYSSFHMHQMIHTNERKKKCTICGSEFRSNSHMTRHMRSHTGERPFECTICGQRFAQRYNMKTHYNTHQGIHRPQSRNHRCLICMEAFPRRIKLNKHLRQAHEVSDKDITTLAENGPDSEAAMKIIERLRSTIYTKEEVLIEYVDGSSQNALDEEIK